MRARLGQIEHRPSGIGSRHRRDRQGAAATQAPPTGTVTAFEPAQPRYFLQRFAVLHPPATASVAPAAAQSRWPRTRISTGRLGLVVWLWWFERPCDHRPVPGAGARRGACRATSDHRAVGPDPGAVATA